jgi:hypothetical protein
LTEHREAAMKRLTGLDLILGVWLFVSPFGLATTLGALGRNEATSSCKQATGTFVAVSEKRFRTTPYYSVFAPEKCVCGRAWRI